MKKFATFAALSLLIVSSAGCATQGQVVSLQKQILVLQAKTIENDWRTERLEAQNKALEERNKTLEASHPGPVTSFDIADPSISPPLQEQIVSFDLPAPSAK